MREGAGLVGDSQVALPYQRALWELWAAAIGARVGGGTAMGGAAEWVERYCGGGHPGMRAARGVRRDARLEEEGVCV